jgi:hypothetical protein
VPPGWAARLEALPHVVSVTGHDEVFRVSTGSGPETTLALMEAAAAAHVAVRSLSVQSTSLDDVFVHYTGRGLRDALQEANPPTAGRRGGADVQRTLAIVERELRRFRRSPTLIVVSMVFPIVQLVVLGTSSRWPSPRSP